MRRLVIEERESGLFRLYNDGALDVMGHSVEETLVWAMCSEGITETYATAADVMDTYVAGEVLDSLMGSR